MHKADIEFVTYAEGRNTEYGVFTISPMKIKFGIVEIVGTHGWTMLIVTVVEEDTVPLYTEFDVYVPVT